MKPQYSIDQILAVMSAMAEKSEIPIFQIRNSESQKREISLLRQFLAKFYYEQMGLTYEFVSSLFGKSRQWSYRAILAINTKLDMDKELCYEYAELCDQAHTALDPFLSSNPAIAA